MSKPEISVIIPVYNSEKYLKKSLDSVRFQTYPNIEIICVDDGSTDKSLEILNEYKSKDSRFVILSQKNAGTSAARNRGIDAANGDYISFIDSDDWVLLTLYKTFVDKITEINRNIDTWVFNASAYIEGKIDTIPRIFYELSDWKNHTGANTLHTFDDCKRPFSRNLSVVNRIYNREFLNKYHIRFPEGLKYEDQVFSIKSFLNAKTILLTDEIFYRYRNNIGITSSNFITPKVFDIFTVVDMIEVEIRKLGVYDSYKYALFQYKYNVWNQHYQYCPEEFKERYYTEMKARLIKMAESGFLNPAITCKLINYNKYEIIKNNTKENYEKITGNIAGFANNKIKR